MYDLRGSRELLCASGSVSTLCLAVFSVSPWHRRPSLTMGVNRAVLFVAVKSLIISASLRTGIAGTCSRPDSSLEGSAKFPARAGGQSGELLAACCGCSCPARRLPYILQSMDGTAGFSHWARLPSCLLKRGSDSGLGFKPRCWQEAPAAAVGQPAPLERDGAEPWGSAGGCKRAPGNSKPSLPSSHWEQGLLCPSWACTDKRGSCFLRRPKAHFAGGSSTCWGSAWSQCRV